MIAMLFRLMFAVIVLFIACYIASYAFTALMPVRLFVNNLLHIQ